MCAKLIKAISLPYICNVRVCLLTAMNQTNTVFNACIRSNIHLKSGMQLLIYALT